MRTRNMIFTAVLALAVAATGASAQVGNQSDVTGVLVTGGEIVGGSYQTGTSGSLTPAQVAEIQTALSQVGAEVNQGLLTGPGGMALSPAAVQALANVLSSPTPENIALLSSALEQMGASEAEGGEEDGLGAVSGFLPWQYAGMGTAAVRSPAFDDAVDELVASLAGLLTAVNSMDPGDIEVRPTERLIHAVDEFNEFVNTVPEESLRNPPHEFLAIHAVLKALVAAATRTDDVGIENNDIGEVEGAEVDE